MRIGRWRALLALNAFAAATALLLAPGASAQPYGAWTAATQLVGGGTVQEYDVAVDPTGQAVALWITHDGAVWAAKSARRRAGASAWESPTVLTTGSTVLHEPRIAMDASGNAIGLWRAQTGPNTIVATRSTAGVAPATWSDPAAISDASCTGDATLPQIAMSSAGDAAAVWRCFDTGVGATWVQGAAYRKASAGWTSPADIAAPDAADGNESPNVAMNASGDAIAVWRHTHAGATVVQASFLGDSGWSTVQDVSATATSASDAIAQPVIDATGRATVAWEDHAHDVLRAASATAAGASWPTPDDLSTPGSNVINPQLIIDSTGAVLAVWNTYNVDSDSFTIHSARRATATGTWTAPSEVVTSASGDLVWIASLHAVGFADSGAAWLVFSRGPYDESTSSVLTTAYDSTADRWSSPTSLVSGRTGDAEPVLGVAGDGGAVALWGDGAGDLTESTFVVAAPPAPPAPPAPTGISWSPSASSGARVVIAPGKTLTATFAAVSGTTYSITARRLARKLVRGTCTRTGTKVRCRIRLPRRGRWLVSITPSRDGVRGAPARLRVTVRAAKPRPEPVTG